MAPQTFVAAIGLFTLAMGAGPDSREDDWPRYGHDARLTGRTSLKGDITQPRVAWTFPTAGRELLFEMIPTSGQHHFEIPPDTATTTIANRKLQIDEAGLRDVDGSGQMRVLRDNSNERWARVLPGVRGWQRIGWSNTWTEKNDSRLRLFAYDSGFDKPRQVWEADPAPGPMMSPLNIVYDIDGDGVPEILVAAHYRIMIFDGATGRKETALQYHTGRPYGWFGLADVDGDGKQELITIGDFQSHIDVLKYNSSKPESERLSVKWRRDLEMHIDERKKWPQIGPHPLANVTGDARPEIVLNFFNDIGDEQWHVVVMDANTGDTLCDMPKRYLQGVADVDGDDVSELFIATAEGNFAPTFAAIELVHIRDRQPEVVWSAPHAAWMVSDLPGPGPTWSSSGVSGYRQVLLSQDARPIFLAQTMGASTQPAAADEATLVASGESSSVHNLVALQCADTLHPQTLWEVHGLPGQVEAVAFGKVSKTGNTGVQIKVRVQANTTASIVGEGADLSLVQMGPLGPLLSTPIAARLQHDGPMTIVVEGAGSSVVAIDPPAAIQPSLHMRWQLPGRGMADGSGATGVLAADLLGDGNHEVLTADQDPLGHARLCAIRPNGSVLWRHSFTSTNGGPPVGNVGALTYWWTGHFRSPDHLDVFVNVRRGPMHSDVGYLLGGRDGQLVWTKEKAIAPNVFQWGYAGTTTGVADMNGDGRDDLVSLYPVCFWIADGKTGDFFFARNLATPTQELPAWAAYGEPIIQNLVGGPEPEVVLDSPYIMALLDKAGKPIWHGPAGNDPVGNYKLTTFIRHALIDFSGSTASARQSSEGQFELASAGYADGVHVVDAKTGKVLWTLSAPVATCAKVTAADIDGRPGDELIYTSDKVLCVISGDRTSGSVLWKWTAPAKLSMPVIADVDDDGRAEIVVQDANGMVYCIDGPAR